MRIIRGVCSHAGHAPADVSYFIQKQQTFLNKIGDQYKYFTKEVQKIYDERDKVIRNVRVQPDHFFRNDGVYIADVSDIRNFGMKMKKFINAHPLFQEENGEDFFGKFINKKLDHKVTREYYLQAINGRIIEDAEGNCVMSFLTTADDEEMSERDKDIVNHTYDYYEMSVRGELEDYLNIDKEDDEWF